MKKRVVGVAVLVMLGVLIPLVLSHCMGSGDTDSDSTRVYEITPNGDARAVSSDNDANSESAVGQKNNKSSRDGFTLDGATGVPESRRDSVRHPEAVSPSSEQSAPAAGGQAGSDNDSSRASTTSDTTGSLERTSAASGWVVQVASFGDQANAERLASQLNKDFDAFYRAGDVSGKTYYRVRIGPFANEADARAAAAKLRQAGRSTLVKRAD